MKFLIGNREKIRIRLWIFSQLRENIFANGEQNPVKFDFQKSVYFGVLLLKLPKIPAREPTQVPVNSI